MPATDVAPDEWECKVFIAVAELRTYSAAAKSLSAQTGQPYAARSVGKVIKKIELWSNETMFEDRLRRKHTTPRGDDFLYSARNIVSEYQLLRHPTLTSGSPTLACMPHHIPFVSRAEAALLGRSPDPIEINLEFLEPRHTGDRLLREAVQRLTRDVFQLLIGPPVTGEKHLVSRDLYEARLEAMVPRSHPTETILLADLLQHRLFVPTDERWRRSLEDRIAAWGVPDPRKDQRIPLEPATSVLRVSNAHHLGQGNHLVVAPSDVTLAFKDRWEFGGSHTTNYRWVPITHQDDNGKWHYLKQKVAVTYRRTESPTLLPPIVEALKKAVGAFRGLSGGPP